MAFISANKITILVIAIIMGSLLLTSGVGANSHIPGIPASPIDTVDEGVNVVSNIVRIVYILFFILAVLFIILAAFTYLTAAGDPTKVSTAKTQLIYAAVAIVVALLSVGLGAIIENFLSANK